MLNEIFVQVLQRGLCRHFSTQVSQKIPSLVISYDIACQWSTHFLQRVSKFPEHLHIQVPAGDIRFAIPMYHFKAHKDDEKHCQFSLHLMRGVGRTDSEEIERQWSRHDATAASTREMGPGSREDTLEDHFSFANWQKYITLGLFNPLFIFIPPVCSLFSIRIFSKEKTSGQYEDEGQTKSILSNIHGRAQGRKRTDVDECCYFVRERSRFGIQFLLHSLFRYILTQSLTDSTLITQPQDLQKQQSVFSWQRRTNKTLQGGCLPYMMFHPRRC